MPSTREKVAIALISVGIACTADGQLLAFFALLHTFVGLNMLLWRR